MVASRSLHASNKLNQGRLEMSVFMMKHIFNYSLKLIQFIYSYISCFAFSLFFSPLTRHGMNDSNNNDSEAHSLKGTSTKTTNNFKPQNTMFAIKNFQTFSKTLVLAFTFHGGSHLE